MISGSRVIRGPGWQGREEDGGEGHLGTVIGRVQDPFLNPDTHIQVRWDNGQISVCSIEDRTEPELLLYDSGPTGIQHQGVNCNGCGEKDIAGFRWRCLDCDRFVFNLCNSCYMGDKHTLEHQFECFSQLTTDVGIKRQCRKSSKKGAIFGISPGACVRTINTGDIINTDGCVTAVTSSQNTSRSAVEVAWPDGTTQTHLVGHYGEIHVQLEEDGAVEVGLVYIDHLPPLFVPPREKFVQGDFVRVARGESFMYLQQKCGLWEQGMEKFRDQTGVIAKDSVEKDGFHYPMVTFHLEKWESCAMNPDCLEKFIPNDNSYNVSNQKCSRQTSGQTANDVRYLSDKELRAFARRIPAGQLGWLASNVGISDAQLSHIIEDHTRTEDRIYKVLLTWRNRLKREEQQVALDTLWEALQYDDSRLYLSGPTALPIPPSLQKSVPALPSSPELYTLQESQATTACTISEDTDSITEESQEASEGDHIEPKQQQSESDYEKGKKLMKLDEEDPASVDKASVPAKESDDSPISSTETDASSRSDSDKHQDGKTKATTQKSVKKDNVFTKGDRVRVKNMSVEELKNLQKGHGGINPLMGMTIGRLGKVKKVDSDDDVKVKSEVGAYFYNPACLVHAAEDEEDGAGDDQSGLFKKGDRVLIRDVSEEEMKKWQKESGGWIEMMKEIRGKPGIVSKVQLTSIVVTMLTGDRWALHPLLLTKDGVEGVSFKMERQFRKGDKVKVKQMDIEQMKRLQKGNGGWSSSLAKCMNKTAVIIKTQMGRVCIVKMENGERAAFYRACLTLIESGPEKASSDDSSDSSDDSDDEIRSHLKKALLGPLKTTLEELGGLGDIGDLDIEDLEGVLGGQGLHISREDLKAKAMSKKKPAELLKVIQEGDRDAVGKILELRPEWVDYLSENGSVTPLLMACQMGYRGMIKLLLEKGAKVDQSNTHQGVTPLILSAYSDRPEIVQLLLEHGADINKCDNVGDTALVSAIVRKNTECVQVLLKPEFKCDVQIRNKKGLSAVDIAVAGSSPSEITAMVIESTSFQPSQAGVSGFNALHAAAKRGDDKSVQIILQRAPEIVNNKKDDGWTALHLAAGNDNYDTMVVILDQKNCDINARNNDGATPLHQAVYLGNVKIVEKLLEKGVDLNAQDKDGDTSLHLACMQVGRLSLVQKLSSGDVEKKKEDNVTIAVELVQKGANVDMENKSGRTALDILRDPDVKSMLQDLAATISKDDVKQEQQVCHSGVQCDSCHCVPICGSRYKCVTCVDYDLCQNCIKKDDVHDPKHGFTMYRTPLRKSSALNHGDSTVKEKKVVVPGNPYFPATDFLEIRDIKDGTNKMIMDKLKQFNSELPESSRHSDKEMAMLQDLLNATSSTSSTTSPTIEQINFLHKILTMWPEDKLFPALDIFRLAITHPIVNEYLCNSYCGDAMIKQVIQRALENDNITVQLLVCRGICNTFLQTHGQEFLSNQKTRDSIIDSVLKLKDIEEGNMPLPDMKKVRLRLAASTLLFNFAVALHDKQEHGWHCVNAIVSMLEKENDPGSNFRLLVALGTLMVDDYEAVIIARNRNVFELLTKFLGPEGEADKVGACASFLSKMMRETKTS